MPWTDEYWPLVMQLYQSEPTGIKPMYSRPTVNLALELHIPPKIIYQKMFMLRQPPTPTLRRLMDTVGSSPKRLKATCKRIRQMAGMGNASAFYDDVPMQETFERDFRPVNARTAQMMRRPLVTPVMLIIILDLYFRLIPATMVKETPDVRDTARLLDIEPKDVVDILEVFQYCDPFVCHGETLMDPLYPPCHEVWERFSTDDPTELSNTAQQFSAYFERRRS